MRRVLLLLCASLVLSLVLAPTAGAQAVFSQSDGSGDSIGDGCPAGQFGAIPAGSLGEEGFACFDTLDEAKYYAETGQQLPEQQAPQETEPPATSTAQYGDDDVPALPDTGGPSLGAIASVLGVALLAGGILLRRRLS